MSTDYATVLNHNYPGKQWTLNGDNYDGLTWLDEGTAPSQTELDAAWPQVQAEIAADAAAKRAARISALKKLGLTDDEIAAIS